MYIYKSRSYLIYILGRKSELIKVIITSCEHNYKMVTLYLKGCA